METKIKKLIADMELSISILEQECEVCGNNGRVRRVIVINERMDLVSKLKLTL